MAAESAAAWTWLTTFRVTRKAKSFPFKQLRCSTVSGAYRHAVRRYKGTWNTADSVREFQPDFIGKRYHASMSFLSAKSPAPRPYFSVSLFSRLAACLTLLLCLPSVWAQSTTLVISQAYGGGGRVNALYSADFVEIFNLSGATQSLN